MSHARRNRNVESRMTNEFDIRHSTVPPADSSPAVRLCGVSKTYRRGPGAPGATVLSGVDLTVEHGECAFLAGPSGSGKTTLLSILGCILAADEGRVELFGQDLAGLGPHERTLLRRDRIGFVFQRFHLIRGLTALENVCVPMTLRGVAARAARRRATALLEAVGLAEKNDAHPRNLSAGQCQRVAIARALVNDPDMVLADEPTASLDAKNGQEVMRLIQRLVTQEGKAAVVVTHDPRIFSFADRIHWLENGQIVDHQGPAQGDCPDFRGAPAQRGGENGTVPFNGASETTSAIWETLKESLP
jgi:putative ABC transport system ATP-binding protein